MLTELLEKSSLFHLLYRIDLDLAKKHREVGCRHCGGPLHQANYERKPRGEPESIPDQYLLRLSFCCGRPDCRCRSLPPSCRFWGQRVYWSCVILVVMALRQNRANSASISKLEGMFGISRQTICRWIEYFREHFPSSAQWQRVRGRVSARVTDSDLPTALLQYFLDHCESIESGLVSCLRFLACGKMKL